MLALAAAININGDRTSQTSRNEDPYLQLPNINVALHHESTPITYTKILRSDICSQRMLLWRPGIRITKAFLLSCVFSTALGVLLPSTAVTEDMLEQRLT